MNPRFEKPLRIRFGHCDPAGIVYFPQYLVMLNGHLEDWFTDGLGVSYAELLGPRRVGTPTVRLECDFKAISRPGDEVVLVQPLYDAYLPLVEWAGGLTGLVLVRQRPGTAKGVIFVTLEDETGTINLVIWPDVMEKQRKVIMGARLIEVKGRVEYDDEVIPATRLERYEFHECDS